VDKENLWRELRRRGMEKKLIRRRRWRRYMWANRDNDKDEPGVHRRIQQRKRKSGYVMSPLLFNLYLAERREIEK